MVGSSVFCSKSPRKIHCHPVEGQYSLSGPSWCQKQGDEGYILNYPLAGSYFLSLSTYFTERSCYGSTIPSVRTLILSWLFRNDYKLDPSGNSEDGSWILATCCLFYSRSPTGLKATYVNSLCPLPQTHSQTSART